MTRGFVLALALAGVALTHPVQAGNLSVTRGPTTEKNHCVGTLEITSDTPAASRTGELNIRNVDSPTNCNSYCGDGIVNGLEECDPKANVQGCSSNCRLLSFPEYGGTSPYLDIWSEMDACRKRPPPVGNSPSGRDVTFLAFGDPQYGNNEYVSDTALDDPPGPGINKNRRDANRRNIVALNRVKELKWPSNFVGAGTNVSRVRGVIIAGDLTQEGDACTTNYFSDDPSLNCGYIWDQEMRRGWFGVDYNGPDTTYYADGNAHVFAEFQQFRDEYGLCGNKKLRYPAFEGAGNHDYWRDVGEEFEHPVHKYIAYRNNFRQGLDRLDPLAKGHYSWTWDDVHFVQLNLAAMDRTTYNCDSEELEDCFEDLVLRTMKANNALTFLKQDLARHAAPGQPVVLISHYPWIGSPWFERDDRVALLQVIKNYNVIALIHGHNHSSAFSRWSPCTNEDDFASEAECLSTLGLNAPPRAIPVIDAGNPLYGNGSNKVWVSADTNRRYGHYTVIRITDIYLEASTVSWHGDGIICDAQTQQACQAVTGCAWSPSQGLCSTLGAPEICLPGVTTLACKPGVTCTDNPMGGWSAKVALANAAGFSCQQAPHQYCIPRTPATCTQFN